MNMLAITKGREPDICVVDDSQPLETERSDRRGHDMSDYRPDYELRAISPHQTSSNGYEVITAQGSFNMFCGRMGSETNAGPTRHL